jgi:hypothetical protein
MNIGNLSVYFSVTGGRDYRDIIPHFHEAKVNQDPEVIGADRYHFRALAPYVVQRPTEAHSVLELKAGKACLWSRRVRTPIWKGRTSEV